MANKSDIVDGLHDAFDRALDNLHREDATHELMRVALIYDGAKKELYLREYDIPESPNPDKAVDFKFTGEVSLIDLMDGIHVFKECFNDGSVDVITAPLMNVIFIYKKEVQNYG